MLGLLFYTVAAFGLAYIVGHSTISLPFRMVIDPGPETTTPKAVLAAWFLMLIECPACFGFWEGLFFGMLYAAADGPLYPREGALAKMLWAVGLALYTCGANFILARLTSLIPAPAKE
jgi:hypothetical protein